MPLKPGYNPSWMQCSENGGCGRWFERIDDFDHHMVGFEYRCLTDPELRAAGVPFLRPEARRWSEQTGNSSPSAQEAA